MLIAAKDLRERIRDRSALIIGIVVPFALAAILGLTLKDVASGDFTFHYAYVDRDDGPAARTFARDVLGRVERAGVIRVRRVASVEAGRSLVDGGDVAAAFVVPSGFSTDVGSGRRARLEVIGDLDEPIGTLVARSIARVYAAEVQSARISVGTAVRLGARESPARLGALAAALPRPVSIRDVSAERKELDATTFYAAGMAVFFLFFTVQFGVSSLLDEKREGTLSRLLAAPIYRAAIVGGKGLTSLVLGVVSMAVLVVGTSLLLGAEWGDPLGVALLVGAGVLAATSVMTLVATLAKTPDQAGFWQSIIALVLGMLGGAFFPVGRAGGIVEKLSLLTPHAWFLRGLGDLTGGAGAAAVLPAVGAILAFAAVTGGLAALRLGRLVEP